jgi:hypothetical protein
MISAFNTPSIGNARCPGRLTRIADPTGFLELDILHGHRGLEVRDERDRGDPISLLEAWQWSVRRVNRSDSNVLHVRPRRCTVSAPGISNSGLSLKP